MKESHSWGGWGVIEQVKILSLPGIFMGSFEHCYSE